MRRAKEITELVYAVFMDGVQPGWSTKKALDVLAGVQIGVLGGMLMLLWFALSAPILGYPWWFVLNLFASYSYRNADSLAGPGMATISGIAIQIAAAGVVGAFHGFLTTGGRLFGLAVSLIWYGLCYGFFWKRYAPLVTGYGPQPLLAIGFFLYGSVLGWHSSLASRLYFQETTKFTLD